MNALRTLLRSLLHRVEGEPGPSTPAPPDPIRETLRAAIAADAKAKAANLETYQARVEAMIADFFARYGDFHVRRPS